MAESKKKKSKMEKKKEAEGKKPATKAKGGKKGKPAAKKKEKIEEAKEKAVKKEGRKPAAKKGKGKAVPKRKPKSKEVKALVEKIKKKKRFLFRGRFGKRSVRKKSKEKWQRWRKPRGIDIYRKKEDGAYPKTGYRTARDIRGKHPSGYTVVLVRNEAELQQAAAGKNAAVLFGAALGKRKRKLLLEKAEKKGITVLNG